MKYLSVCSGIEAATVAWHPLGWSPVAFAEVDKFPSAVLAHHYPDVPNRGDMTKFREWDDTAFDVLVGGTPCQSFSVAGLRAGLDDPRGSLMLTYLALAGRYRPDWLVWENVPGVLSADGGSAFGSLLGGLAELGYGFAYRVLDAQYFGLAQRRQRVFVVGHLGDWRRAAAVLFERESLSGHPAPRREAGQVAPTVPSRRSAGGGLGTDFDCDGGLVQAFGGNNTAGQIDIATACLSHPTRQDDGSETFIAEWPRQVTNALDCSFADKHGQDNQHIDSGAPWFVPAMRRADGLAVSNTLGTARRGYDVEATYVPVDRDNVSDRDGDDLLIDFLKDDVLPITGRGGEDGAINGLRDGSRIRGIVDGDGDVVNTADRELSHLSSSRVAEQADTLYHKGINHASTQKTYAGTLLRTLSEAVGAEAFTQWGLGILDSLLPAEVLRSRLHGCGVRLSAGFSRRWLVYHALARPEAHSEGFVQAMREAEREGRASQGWRPQEQFARELGAYLSELSQPGAQASRFMRDLWQASEGLGLLREALSAVQEVGRSAGGEGQPAREGTQVRRLTVEECEFLQGFPRGYTAIPYRGKPAADGPRYKALGNSMAVPCMRWIGRRIALVESIARRGDERAS